MKRLAILVLFLVPLPAVAWTRVSDQRIADKAATLAPPDLAMVLQKFDGDYKHGLRRAEAEEGDATHHYFVLSRSGKLRERIDAETASAIKMIRRGDPMAKVVERLGVIAHLVADANNPFHVANDDSRLSLAQNDFEQYFERSLAKVPTVFYGLDDDDQPRRILEKTFARTRAFYPLLREEYFRGGSAHTSADFDDRSTAFGVASVCYSHAVTDLVNIYYYVWRKAGGDVRSAKLMRSGNLVLNP